VLIIRTRVGAMNSVLVILQVAVLLTVMFAYGRR